jgi:UDP-N-acetylmuramoylalanine--D-glutamate ligase
MTVKAVILGMARQGLALARYLAATGARVTLSDAKPEHEIPFGQRDEMSSLGVRLVLGGHPESLLDGCDVLYLSGGVPIDLPIVLAAARRGIPLSNDAQVFAAACPVPITAITGSAGKTTTTTLIGEMLRETGRVLVGGNIGNPLIADLAAIAPGDRVVMELSSFQLEQMTLSPHVAVVTNITPNHLDRHGTMQAYIAAKRHILDFQREGDWQILSADDPVVAGLPDRFNTARFSLNQPQPCGAWLDASGDLQVRMPMLGTGTHRICNRRELKLMGDHNVLNVLAAACATLASGGMLEAIRAVATRFRGVAHRLQLIAEINGARYYDDSIATAPERLMAALRCFEQPVILLAGGRDKHLPWDDAAALMGARCKHIALFGEMGPMVADALRTAGVPASLVGTHATLEAAVTQVKTVAGPGDVVLLSPGGTSYDAFKDFAERGDRFRHWVTQGTQEG